MRKDFVATGFIVRENKTLLVMHKKMGLWLPVGGHLEQHETPEEALHREAMEETGLEIKVGKPFLTWTKEMVTEKYKGKRLFLVGYKCKYISGGYNEYKQFNDV